MSEDAPGAWRNDVGPLIALVATAAGAWVGPGMSGVGAGPSAVSGLLGLGGLALAAAVRRGSARVALAAVACGLLGAVAGARAWTGLTHHPLQGAVASGRPLLVRADVVGDPSPWRWSTDVVVRVRAVAPLAAPAGGPAQGAAPGASSPMPRPRWTSVRPTRVLVRATGDDARRAAALRMGDRVVLDTELVALGGFDRRRRWEHIVAATREATLVGFSEGGGPLERAANAVRDRLGAGMRMLGADDRALLAGFLLGDTRAVPDRVRDEFRAAGLSHVLAVSGANVAFVLGLLGPLLGRLRLGARFAGTIGVLALFATVTRFEPSVLRACAMAALVALSTLLGRPVSALRRLCHAAVVLLLVDPFLVHSVGFGLSLGASAGIVVLAGSLARRIPGPEWLRASLWVSIAAQVGVLPVSLAVFGSVPGLAPLANLFAVPATEPVTVLGIVVSGLLGCVGPGLRNVLSFLQWPVVGLIVWVRMVARVAAAVPLALDVRASAVLSAVGVWWARRHRARREPGGSVPAHDNAVAVGRLPAADPSASDPSPR